MAKVFIKPARIPQAQGCQPEPSNKCPHPCTKKSNMVTKRAPQICIPNKARTLPIERVAKRARKSALPQANAVARPNRMPMRGYLALFFFTSRPSSAMTF